MSSKDLNLTLDERLVPLASPAGREAPGESPGAGGRPDLRAIPAGPRTREPGSRFLAIALVVLANMAFMAAVGYLLWIRFEPLTAPTLMPAPAAVPLTPAALAELRAGHQQLQTRLEQVQAGLRELGAVVEAGEARLSGQMETLRTRPIASGETPEPAPPVAAQPKPVATQWLVNAGAFSEARQAAALGRRLTELGFAVRVEAQQADAEILHQVQITGFADRESAEGAARELTERLDLNGLWAAEAG